MTNVVSPDRSCCPAEASGIDLNECSVGDRWLVGTSVLEVAHPRAPCFKLGMRMGDASFAERFDAANRPAAVDDDDLLRRLADDPRIPAGWRRAAARALRVLVDLAYVGAVAPAAGAFTLGIGLLRAT